ncbi:MAG: helix-turn-helix transcriptional regulator [Bacteroidales bacterium]|jgi:transcriptional regulator with XRE-family HTH domain|nr:helix-turn-helix transcriptional regulator [Bacteroidales bacterium]NLM91318.1 helix-turn-helix transcriptional regulator [Bacteroidales bacterium]
MIKRIQKIMQLKKLTSSAFADKVGVPRSTISHILSGRNNPSLEFVQKVLDSFPEIRTEWLIRGESHMLKASNTLFPDEDFELSEVIKSPLEEKADIAGKEEKISPSSQAREEISKSEGDKKMPEKEVFSDKDMPTARKKSDISVKFHKKAIRVMLFYADGTFFEYFPEQQ